MVHRCCAFPFALAGFFSLAIVWDRNFKEHFDVTQDYVRSLLQLNVTVYLRIRYCF